MASKEYLTVRYHATKDVAKESIPEVLLDNAKDRENSEGNGDFYLNHENSYSLCQQSGSNKRDSHDDDIDTANIEKDESKSSMGKCTNFTTSCMKNPFFICTVISCIGYLFKRFFSLASSCWMLVDMILDVRQTYVYYEHSFNPNGTYNTWAIEFNRTNHTTYFHTVSPAYFNTAVVVWALPPLLMSAVYFLGNLCSHCLMILLNDVDDDVVENGFDEDFNNFKNTNGLLSHFSTFEIKPPFNNRFLNILVYLFYIPIDFLISSIVVYIIIPYMSLKAGALVAWTGNDDPDRMITKNTDAGYVPAYKLFENLGEAIPQAIMIIIFISNNWDFILYDETSFIPIPTSCISLIFSLGSIIMGLISGGKAIEII